MIAHVFVLLLVALVKQTGGWNIDTESSAFHTADECQSAMASFQDMAAKNPDTAPPGFTLSCEMIDVKLVTTAANDGAQK